MYRVWRPVRHLPIYSQHAMPCMQITCYWGHRYPGIPVIAFRHTCKIYLCYQIAPCHRYSSWWHLTHRLPRKLPTRGRGQYCWNTWKCSPFEYSCAVLCTAYTRKYKRDNTNIDVRGIQKLNCKTPLLSTNNILSKTAKKCSSACY